MGMSDVLRSTTVNRNSSPLARLNAELSMTMAQGCLRRQPQQQPYQHQPQRGPHGPRRPECAPLGGRDERRRGGRGLLKGRRCHSGCGRVDGHVRLRRHRN
jgi:hypothetical protein